jgi:hypothetical protein
MNKEFKNKTVYIRESYNEEHPFTIISNHLVKDQRLNASEKGLMLMILSNCNDYILNSTYLQKESGLGKTTFNKSIKTLQKVGYLLKKPLQNGGYKWIVMESTLIFEDLQKIGYLTYDSTKSIWVINEALEPSLKLFDFHRKSNKGNPEIKKPVIEIPVNQNPVNRNTEFQPIINTNTTSTNIGINKKEKRKNGENNNETLGQENQNLESYFELETEENISNPDQPFQVNNSLPILLENFENFKEFLNNVSLTINDFNGFSDAYIAHIVLVNKFAKNDNEWRAATKDLNYDHRKLYGGLLYACKYALRLNTETELKKQLFYQSNLSEEQLRRLIIG